MEQPAHTVPAPEPDAGAAGPQPLRVQAATALARRLQGDALMVAAVPDDDGGCGVQDERGQFTGEQDSSANGRDAGARAPVK